MITYFIKSGICLALLLLFYHLILEREKMHQFNRFYLLGSVLFSFVAPFYKIYIETASNTVGATASLITDSTMNLNTVEEINYTQYLFVGYAIVAIILLIRFIKNLFDIFLKIKRHQKIKKGKTTLVLVDDAISPHTFWNYIFINKEEYNSNKIETELYTHELTHALQKHTFDILLIELLQIIFWINPTFIFLKKAIKLNHEFLADNKVITTHKNTTKYQYLLLNRATWNNEYYLASNLNYLLTKKRLLMMTKQSSRTKILLKKLAVIPVIAGFAFLFAERVEAETTKKHVLSTETSKDSIPSSVTVYKKSINHEDVEITYHDEKKNKITKKISELTENEKEQLPPPPSPTSRIVIKGEALNIPPPPPHSYGVIREEETSNIPPPSINAIEYIYQNKNADFYFDDKKLSYNEVIKLIKNKKGLRTLIQAKNNKKIIKFYSKKVTKNTNNINTSDIKYYLDGKLISKEKLHKIAPKDIRKVDVKKNKDGTGLVYVTSNK